MGRINHEHVIPFSELTLKELIGSGAEGKVRWGVVEVWLRLCVQLRRYILVLMSALAGSAALAHTAVVPADIFAAMGIC